MPNFIPGTMSESERFRERSDAFLGNLELYENLVVAHADPGMPDAKKFMFLTKELRGIVLRMTKEQRRAEILRGIEAVEKGLAERRAELAKLEEELAA